MWPTMNFFRIVISLEKVLNSHMQIKGFENKTTTVETPNDRGDIEKPLKEQEPRSQRVDINVLKSKLRERENVILRKNVTILISCLALIIIAGICVTYL